MRTPPEGGKAKKDETETNPDHTRSKGCRESSGLLRRLGLEALGAEYGGLRALPLGGIVLGLYPLQELEVDTTLTHQPTTFSGMTLSYNAVSEEEVGAVVVKPAEQVFWGGYSGYFRDLDGYVIEVAHNPHWHLDANGHLVL